MRRAARLLALLILPVLAACSQVSQVPGTSVWESEDIGIVDAAGALTVVGEPAPLEGSHDLQIEAAGSDLSGAEDSFHFGYVAQSGDVDISARIDEVASTHDSAKAGIMIRAGLQAGAAHASMNVTPAGSAEFIWRETAGSEAIKHVHEGELPVWVRLERQGSTVTGSVSSDGEEWTEVRTVEVALEEDVHVGVAATSSMIDQLGMAGVSSLTVRNGNALEPVDKDGPGNPPSDGNPGNPPPADGNPGGPPPADDDNPSNPPVAGSDQWVCSSQPLAPRYEATMYVSTDGSDSNDGRSASRPLRTLQRAASLVGPGDVVWVRGGVYSSNVDFRASGTASRKIVFESYPGECAILDGSGENQRVRFSNASHNVFRNFVVRNSPQEGIFMHGSHENVISNIISHNNSINGLLTMEGNNNLITKFIAFDNYSPGRAGDADGISISTGNGNRIIDCVAFGNSDDGVDTWLSTNTVIENCVSFGNGYHNGQEVGDGNGFKAGGRSNNANTIIRNSIAFNNRANGFDFNSGRNVTFDNNTAFGNGRHGFNITGGTVRNNIAFQNRNSALNGSGNTLATNSWDLGINQPGFVSTDPESSGFLSLSSGSPARGAGTDLGHGSRPDLGALQNGATIAALLSADQNILSFGSY
jgi:regulation of enolase protein 1 (concanavalin A-like superfamily)